MKMKSFLKIVISTIVIIACSFTSVFSQELIDEAAEEMNMLIGIGFPESSQKIQSSIGLGTGFVPEYEGSDDYGATLIPLVDIRMPGVYFINGVSINPNKGLASAGVTVLHISCFEKSSLCAQLVIGPYICFHGGRDQDSNDALKGLGDIDPSVGVGGFMEFKAGSLLADFTISSQNAGDVNGRPYGAIPGSA